jgi:hypothetical protein
MEDARAAQTQVPPEPQHRDFLPLVRNLDRKQEVKPDHDPGDQGRLAPRQGVRARAGQRRDRKQGRPDIADPQLRRIGPHGVISSF